MGPDMDIKFHQVVMKIVSYGSMIEFDLKLYNFNFRRFWWQVRYKLSRCCQYKFVYETLFGKFSGSSASDQAAPQLDQTRRVSPPHMNPGPRAGAQGATAQLGAEPQKVD